MSVRRAIRYDLHPGIGGAVARDRSTGDWLVIMSPQVKDEGMKYKIFNELMAQVDEWERRHPGIPTWEVRAHLRMWAG